MKNGRALKGHKRVQVAIGSRPVARNLPTVGGWTIGCICGWDGGHYLKSATAQVAYRHHLDYQIDHCLIRCKRCGVEKPRSEMRSDYRYVCLGCYSQLGNEWQRRHPIESARHKRNHHLLKKFGITLEEAEQLLVDQEGCCAICRQSIVISLAPGHSPHVDHDHKTGQVRGILCFPCNIGLGGFRDDPVRLRSALEYLEKG